MSTTRNNPTTNGTAQELATVPEVDHEHYGSAGTVAKYQDHAPILAPLLLDLSDPDTTDLTG
jgi:hypothetical protein